MMDIMSSKPQTSPSVSLSTRRTSIENGQQHPNDAILDAFTKLSLTPQKPVRGTTISLSIPLDSSRKSVAYKEQELGDDDEQIEKLRQTPPKRSLRRRDSLERREALLKGKEGSRRRQKWENDHLIGNPYVQPPLPMDWEVRPMHPVRVVPYALAAIWDARQEEQQRKAARRTSAIKVAIAKTANPLIITPAVPRSFRAKIKRSHGAKSLLQELEEEVRKFVQNYREAEAKYCRRDSSVVEDEDDEDDFVVVRPNSSHSIESDYVDLGPHPEREKLVFNSLEDDQTAGFGRYLVHSLGRYYDLDTYSITKGKPARREAYVAIKDGEHPSKAPHLPQPLYGMV